MKEIFMIIVKEVKTKREQKDFLNFPLNMYKTNPYFVPPLYMDEKKIFNKDYVYHDQCDAVFFNAYDGNKIVGRISGILQKVSNEKNNERRVRFTRFDTIDNQEVANKLFEAVENWAKTLGMDTICGPLGYSDLEREGLLIEGFDQLSTFEEQYNHQYYQKLIENCGYVKEVDWVEYKLKNKVERDDRLKRLSDIMLKRYKLHYGEAKNTKDFIKKYGEKLFELLDETYVNLYGTVPFTKAMKDMMISNFKLIINLKFVAVILDENDNVVCFGLCLPSIGKALQKSKGHLTIPALIRVLKSIKKPEIIDLALIGVSKEYQMRGVSSSLIYRIQEMLDDKNIQFAETNLNLENNVSIQNQWKNFDAKQHKRRRSFVKKI